MTQHGYMPTEKEIADQCERIALKTAESFGAQGGNRIDRRGGPRLLLAALIHEAIRTIGAWKRREGQRIERQYQSHVFKTLKADFDRTEAWLWDDKSLGATSFLACCDVLDLDPAVVRERAYRPATDNRCVCCGVLCFDKSMCEKHAARDREYHRKSKEKREAVMA